MSLVATPVRRIAAVFAAPHAGTVAGTVWGFFASLPTYRLIDGILILLVFGVPMIAVEVAKSRIQAEGD